MKIAHTETDRQMFEQLSDSVHGRWLISYVKRVVEKNADIRTMTTMTEVQARKEAVEIIEENILKPLELLSEDKEVIDEENYE